MVGGLDAAVAADVDEVGVLGADGVDASVGLRGVVGGGGGDLVLLARHFGCWVKLTDSVSF